MRHGVGEEDLSCVLMSKTVADLSHCRAQALSHLKGLESCSFHRRSQPSFFMQCVTSLLMLDSSNAVFGDEEMIILSNSFTQLLPCHKIPNLHACLVDMPNCVAPLGKFFFWSGDMQ